MSGFAPNQSSSSQDEGYASLTASLLARKGEAAPAVDATAHAGVNIDFGGSDAPGPIEDGRARLQAAYPANPGAEIAERYHGGAVDNGYRDERQADEKAASPGEIHYQNTDDEVWTPPPAPPMSPARRARRALERTPQGGDRRRANVHFKMPAKEFVRLRLAARALEMSAQSIILEALDCYLDANDVAPVSDEVCEGEIERLKRAATATRAKRG